MNSLMCGLRRESIYESRMPPLELVVDGACCCPNVEVWEGRPNPVLEFPNMLVVGLAVPKLEPEPKPNEVVDELDVGGRGESVDVLEYGYASRSFFAD